MTGTSRKKVRAAIDDIQAGKTTIEMATKSFTAEELLLFQELMKASAARRLKTKQAGK